jgi:hypothetical protein
MVDSTSQGSERLFIVGGYPASPSWAADHQGLVRFVHQLLSWQSPADRSMGLEVPYASTSPWAEPSVLGSTPPTSRHVLTMIPATMTELRSREGYGLASEDEEGRHAAVHDVRGAVEFAQRVNAGSGGKVTAIEIQSAPREPLASADALRRSMEDLAHADLGDVRLWVEHCDARIPGQDFEKGFLSLEDELGVVGTQEGLGVLINWGRSAIELRSAERVTEHVEAAVDAGLLQALIFSGVAAATTEYGPPWADAHLPVKGSLDGDGAVFDSSLLTRERAERALRAAGLRDLACVGIKMGMPKGTPDEARLAMLQANVEMIAGLVDVEMQRAADVDRTTQH